jgi:hypothetical protein
LKAICLFAWTHTNSAGAGFLCAFDRKREKRSAWPRKVQLRELQAVVAPAPAVPFLRERQTNRAVDILFPIPWAIGGLRSFRTSDCLCNRPDFGQRVASSASRAFS